MKNWSYSRLLDGRANGVRRHKARSLAAAVALLVGVAVVTALAGAATSVAASAPIGVSIVGPFAAPPGGTVNFAEEQGAATAAVDSLNASGGIHGRKLDVTMCDDMFTAANDTTCFEQIVQNTGIVAEAGGYLTNANTIQPIVDSASLPVIGDFAGSQASLTDPNWFLIGPTQNQIFYGAGEALAARGEKSLALLDSALATTPLLYASVQQGAKRYGATVGQVSITQATVDLSSAVAGLLAFKPQGIILAVSVLQIASVEQLLKSSGYTGDIIFDTDIDGPADLKTIGVGARDVGVGSLPPATENTEPGVKAFSAALAKYAPGTKKDSVSLHVWVSFQILAQALKAIKGPITRLTVERELRHLKMFNTGGLTHSTPTWWTKPGPVASTPRIIDNWIVEDKLTGGVMTWNHKFYPGFTP